MSYEDVMLQDRVARSTAHLESRSCVDCDTDSDVEIVVDGTYEMWTCPSCGAEHEGEHNTEPDPDDYNDAMADMRFDD